MSRRAVAVSLVVVAGFLALPAIASPAIYRGKADEEIFQPNRPKTDVVFQVKGKRARFRRLVLAFNCEHNGDNDPRYLVAIRTPFRRLHMVVGNRSYDFHKRLERRLDHNGKRIKLSVTVSIYGNKVDGSLNAWAGSCSDTYTDITARRR
jgi:hypothetical protein